MTSLKVKNIMTPSPRMISPAQTVQEAARIMKDEDIGVLPVGSPDKVVGVITDRDITVRVTASGRDASKTCVRDAMSRKFITCEEEDDIERAAELMRKHDVSRVMVSDFDHVTGIVTIADLLRNKGDRHKSDKVLHQLLGRKSPVKHPPAEIERVYVGDANCDLYDDTL